jgi:hypothetical protein
MCELLVSVRSRRRASLTPIAWGESVGSPESPAERFLRVVANTPGNGKYADVGIQEALRDVHPPFGQIADGRASEHLPEALIKQ